LPHILIKNSKRNSNISKKEKQWLQTIEHQLQRNLEHNKKIEKYNVDGYDKVKNTVYEFNGCFFHGCQRCYDSEEFNPMTGHKMKHHYQKTIMKEKRLRELGYNVKSVSECEFNPSEDIEINNIIKCNNKYKMISNGEFIFKDIVVYLSPGTSLEKYLRAFDSECPKGVFPHRVTQKLDQYLKENPDLKFEKRNIIELLKKSSIPEKKWFYNDLTRSNVSNCNYSKIKSNYENL
jgi:G:T-mismatch repair DNA endonuclease (very short patch repair protein)